MRALILYGLMFVLAACATPAPVNIPMVQTEVIVATREPRPAGTRVAEARKAASTPTNTPAPIPTQAALQRHLPVRD